VLTQRREVTGVHGGGQQLRLYFEVAGVGRSQPLLERRQIFKVATDRHMVSVVQARLGAEESIALLILFDERGLIVGAQRRVPFIPPVEHGLQSATIAMRYPSAENVASAIGPAE
jgi:hypothetical protein